MRALAVLLLLPLFLLAACGGGDEPEPREGLLDGSFAQPIRSADLDLTAQLELEGGSDAGGPVKVEIKGPFLTRGKGLPQADIDVHVGTEGSGQVVETGFVSTGDRAFVKFQDVYYEQPPEEVRKADQSLRRGRGGPLASLSALGLDPSRWIATAEDEGEETVDGVATRHVSGLLDTRALLRDLNRLVRGSGKTLGATTGQEPPKPLTAEDMAQVERVVQPPAYDAYVGVEDDILRRLTLRVEMRVPEADQPALNGLEGGKLTLTLELHDVNGDQFVQVPERARPLRELTRLLGGAGALGDLAEGLTGGVIPDDPLEPDKQPSPPPRPPSKGSGGEGPDAEDFKAYTECLDEVPPGDTEALQECADLLR